MGRLSETLRQVWVRQDDYLARFGNRQEARDRAIEIALPALQESLADTLDLLLKIANDAGVDLESAYLGKLKRSEMGEDAGGS
jgi:hypothetical protein